MKVTRNAVITFVFSALFGAVCGFFLFRAWLPFTPGGQHLQDEFIQACRWGNTQQMERLYLAGASPTALSEYGMGEPVGPPIIEAAEHGRAEAVQWLIDHGAQVNVWVADGYSPLSAAQVHLQQAQKTLEVLKTHGAKLAHEQDSK